MHYKRWRNHGSPRPEVQYHRGDTFEDRFWAKVAKGAPDECWEWLSVKNHRGYGLVRPGGVANSVSAHRASWELANGPIPDGMFILHSCDNTSCVNPAHLRPGTHSENTREAVERGRYLRGERHKRARLTDVQAAEIIARYKLGAAKRLAEQYGVSPSTIYALVSGQNWKHLQSSHRM